MYSGISTISFATFGCSYHLCYDIQAKSLYISRAVSNFYGTEIEIWAGFGPVGNTEKKNWANNEQLLRAVFSCFHGQIQSLKFFKKYPSVCTEKFHETPQFFKI